MKQTKTLIMKDSIIGVEKIKINIKYLFQNILCPMILNVYGRKK